MTTIEELLDDIKTYLAVEAGAYDEAGHAEYLLGQVIETLED